MGLPTSKEARGSSAVKASKSKTKKDLRKEHNDTCGEREEREPRHERNNAEGNGNGRDDAAGNGGGRTEDGPSLAVPTATKELAKHRGEDHRQTDIKNNTDGSGDKPSAPRPVAKKKKEVHQDGSQGEEEGNKGDDVRQQQLLARNANKSRASAGGGEGRLQREDPPQATDINNDDDCSGPMTAAQVFAKQWKGDQGNDGHQNDRGSQQHSAAGHAAENINKLKEGSAGASGCHSCGNQHSTKYAGPTCSSKAAQSQRQQTNGNDNGQSNRGTAAAERQQLSSIRAIDSPGGVSAQAVTSPSPPSIGGGQAPPSSSSSSSDGGCAYTTDDSGTRQSKLDRRERLRQKIMSWVGCSYADAKLALAEADTGRLIEGTYRFRGDAWRLSRACEIWTTRATALKREQRAKWQREVQLAAGCTSSLAALAVSVAECEPTLIRDGKLQVPRLVQWACTWIQERRDKRKSESSYYEESFVAMLQRDKAKKERENAAAAWESAPTVFFRREEETGAPARAESLRLTAWALGTLFDVTEKEGQGFAPLEPDEPQVRELVGALVKAAEEMHGNQVGVLSPATALPALEASRYLPTSNQGRPSILGALECLERCDNRERWQQEVEQIARRAGVDLDTAREARRAAARLDEGTDLVEAGVRWLASKRGDIGPSGRHMFTEAPDTWAEHKQPELVLTRRASEILLQNADGLPEVLPPLEAESELVKELTAELKYAVRGTYPGAAELSDTRALLALEARGALKW